MSPADTVSIGPHGGGWEASLPLVSHPIFASHTLDVASAALLQGLPNSAATDSVSDRDLGLIDGITSGAIEFRVTRSGLPTRRLQLTGHRYTFGSAEGCSVRLNDPSLRPMHAVLNRDANRILVRAYSVPIEWNGTRTTEASLEVGDVIRLGAYQLELLSKTSPTNYPIDFDRAGSAVSAPASDQLDVWREQLRREVAQWRARQAECDRREGRCDDRETVLRTRESELWSRAEQLHRRESHLMAQESAAQQVQEEFASKQQELVRLREENLSKQQELAKRETEYRSLQQDYHEHVAQASRQLQQSQQQAEAATQAVQRMRNQFEELNVQLEALQTQQADLQQREDDHNAEHERLRRELEIARDEAIDGRAESESQRIAIEKRIAQLEAELQQAQVQYQTERQRAEECEGLADRLRDQVERLQENVRQASDETALLRQDYEQACESVRSLESIIQQGNLRGELDRESWYGEAEELRQSVEQLSIELAQANGELGDLRKANEKLSARLHDLTRERDEAVSEADSRPTRDALESLRLELDQTNLKLTETQREYEQTVQRLEAAQAERLAAQTQAEAAQAEAEEARALAAEAESRLQANSGVPGSDLLGHPATTSLDEPSPWTSQSNDDPWALPEQSPLQQENQELAQLPQMSTSASELPTADDDEHHGWPTYDSVPHPPATQAWMAAEADTEAAREGAPTQAEQVDANDSGPSTSSQSSPTEFRPMLDFGLHDKPHWSHEPMQKSDAPHFETGEGDDWDTEGSSADRESSSRSQDDHLPSAARDADEADDEYEAEFDRATQTHSQQTDAGFDNDSLDQTLDQIEKGVDEALADHLFSPNPTSPVATEQNAFAGDHAASDPQPLVDDTEYAESSLAAQLIKALDSSDAEPRLENEELWDARACEALDTDRFDANSDQVDTEDSWEHTQLLTEEEAEIENTFRQPFAYSPSDEAAWSSSPWERDDADESIQHEEPSSDDHFPTEMLQGDPLGPVLDSPEEGMHRSPLSGLMDDAEPASTPNPAESTDDQIDSLVGTIDAVVEAVETTVNDAEDEDSIEAYMNRLLQRVQGESGSSTTSAPKSTSLLSSVEPAKSHPMEANSSPPQPSEADSLAQKFDPEAPLVPRSQAPERNSNLSVMRELANQSARTAVAHSVRIQARDIQLQAVMRFVQAGIAALCGLACFVFLNWSFMLKLLVVVAILVISVILVQEGLVLFAEAKRRLQITPPPDDQEPDTIAEASV